MGINYSKFTEIPKCLECGEPLCDEKAWKRYIKKNKVIGNTGCTLTPKIINSKEYYRVRCDKCFEKKFGRRPKKLNCLSYDMEYLLNVPKNELKQSNSKRSVTLENMIFRYGEEEGAKKFNEYREKQAYTNSEEYYIKEKGFTKEEYQKYNSKRSVTLENMISKYGKEKGTKKFNEYREKQAYTNSMEYYKKKFGKNWKSEFDKTQNKKLPTLENFMNRHGPIKGFIKFQNFINSFSGFSSKIATGVFKYLEKLIIEDFPEIGQYIKYVPKNKEHVIIENGKRYMIDFVILGNINLAIEFNGSNYHANPKKYSENVIPIPYFFPELTAGEIWKRDNIKNDIIKKYFDLKIIWDDSFGYSATENLKNNTFKYNKFLEEFYKNEIKVYLDEKFKT